MNNIYMGYTLFKLQGKMGDIACCSFTCYAPHLKRCFSKTLKLRWFNASA